MANERTIARYRRWYRTLLHCYPRPYRERFAEGMDQTFHDLCRERVNAGQGLLGFVLWLFVETAAGILEENGRYFVMQYKNFVRTAIGVGFGKFLRIVSPVAIFALAIAAWEQMQNAVAVNIAIGVDNRLRQLFFQPTLPTHPYVADAWLWTSSACFLYGIITVWRLLRTAKHERHT
jgi:hypothetical protein